MAIYSLAPAETIGQDLGRKAFPGAFRVAVRKKYGSLCNLCNTEYPDRSLSIDHRVPYIVGGESAGLLVEDFQLLCLPHQRKKSWECEHCPNRVSKDPKTCGSCFYAFPDGTNDHVATLRIDRIEVPFVGDAETKLLNRLRETSPQYGKRPEDLVKQLIGEFLNTRK